MYTASLRLSRSLTTIALYFAQWLRGVCGGDPFSKSATALASLPKPVILGGSEA